MATRSIRIACGIVLALSSAVPASAQLSEFTSAPTTLGVRLGSAAYDPVHDLYFVAAIEGVSGSGSARTASVTGHFIDRSGMTIASFPIDSGFTLPQVAMPTTLATYSPDVSNGLGGIGGFVAMWSSQTATFSQIVSYPVGLVGSKTIVTPQSSLHIGLAYSPIDRVFLAALAIGSTADSIVRLDLNAHPIDQTQLSTSPNFNCLTGFEFQQSCGNVDVAWNPVSREFGVVYSQGPQTVSVAPPPQKVLARIAGTGAVLGRTPLAIAPFWGALAVDLETGSYIVISTDGETVIDRAEVSADGSVIAQGVLTTILEAGNAGLNIQNLSYSETSGTFLLSGQQPSGLTLLELDPTGSQIGPPVTLSVPGDPLAMAAHASTAEWLVATEFEAVIIRSSTRLSSCSTPDPFVVLGGGTCFNGGWLPPGDTPPAPLACIGPDPFAALGGGHCVNGGWLPPTNPVVAPPPPPPAPSPSPSPTGCATPDPFVAMGGGRCVNGGWIPPDMVIPPPPPPTPCTTPDPFVAIGGGVCVNGGWRPRGAL